MKSTTRSSFSFLVLLLFSSLGLHANNGALAYIYPISNITIDGNGADWPASIKTYPLSHIFYGNGLTGPEDGSALWRGGYDATSGHLYFLVTMADNDYVKTPDNNHYSSHDFQVLYIDPMHTKKGSGVIAYELDEDHRKIVEQEGLFFYSQVKNASFDQVEIAIEKRGKTVTYEWKIKVSGSLNPGRVIGFDYAVFDKDTDEDHVMLTWGNTGGNKFTNSNLIGDVMLLGPSDQPATVKGALQWKGEPANHWPSSIQFVNANKPDVFVNASVDSLGQYELKLPQGNYDIIITPSWQMNRWFQIDLVEGAESLPSVSVIKDKVMVVDAISVMVANKPNLIPTKGILHTQFDKTASKKVDDFVEAYQSYYNIPAVSLALIQNGQLVYHNSYGVENNITKKTLRDKAVFEAASITKLAFAYVMNRLVQRGEFDLDKPLYETLPFPELEEFPEYKLMTGRHVLTHVSGLPNWGERMINTPGTTYGYSGEGFEYLKKVLAKGDFDNLPEIIQSYLDTELLGPLGMTNTYFMCNDQLPNLKVAGHFNGIPSMYDCPDWPGMAFSMHTEAKDFVPFALALLNRKGLTDDQAQKMFRFHTLEEEENWRNGYKSGYGLGVALRESPHGLVFGHGGNNGDFRCIFEMYDDLDSGYIMYTNANTAGPLLYDLTNFLVEGKN
ncbi:MAG: serine hydrolase [Bacteroidota bacterium]